MRGLLGGLLAAASALAPADTVDLDAANRALAAIAAGTATLGDDETESWSNREQELARLRQAVDEAEVDLARTPIPGSRFDTWLRTGEAHRAEAQRWAGELERAAHDRQTLNWWLDQRSQASAPSVGALVPVPERGDASIMSRHAVAVFVLFAAAVAMVLRLLLQRRPRRRHRSRRRASGRRKHREPSADGGRPGTGDVSPMAAQGSTAPLAGRRRRRRRSAAGGLSDNGLAR